MDTELSYEIISEPDPRFKVEEKKFRITIRLDKLPEENIDYHLLKIYIKTYPPEKINDIQKVVYRVSQFGGQEIIKKNDSQNQFACLLITYEDVFRVGYEVWEDNEPIVKDMQEINLKKRSDSREAVG